ncbi:MAG: putative ABC transporter ATP-binding protein YjjK [Candidatus Izimaplasma bacterium HR2]|nr:MAG: putative ABC transporter ATP-binding protein YjjK [Candidatus Izimaplasma bacterium HR2]
MIECNINNISKSFGADLIFENISFDIKTNERIGLVGPNGCGKTTIMKILIGDEHIQLGTISFRKGTKIGYLDQIPNFSDDKTVIEILENAFKEVYKLKREIDSLTNSFSSLSEVELETALKRYSSMIEKYELLDGYLIETNIKKVCSGLKINDNMKLMTFNLLSGGEKTRVMLARILLEKPSILMLDEPSNHLDLESIEWLESYLKDYDGAVLIISHDRYFLDNVCKKIIELTFSKAHVYHGNYSYYVIEKERRFLLELKVYLAHEKKIKRMEDQIERYRVWGRMRDSDKMFKRAKELERRLSKIEKLDKPKYENIKMKVNNIDISRSGKRVLSAYNIDKSFDDLILLMDTEIDLIYQDRLAILGNNGSGKSTFIKILLEDYNLEEPLYKWGSKVKIGYLAQEVKFKDDSLSVLDYFMKEHEVNQSRARTELAKALFIRDDVFKSIRNLSGGEKSKLKLCSLTFNKVNLMILDEPTNHLDIDSREILEELLLEFTGTILFVSHDRYFIKKIANRVGEIDDYHINYYEGDYDYYRYIKKRI